LNINNELLNEMQQSSAEIGMQQSSDYESLMTKTLNKCQVTINKKGDKTKPVSCLFFDCRFLRLLFDPEHRQ
jgi:hypothetical protein